MALADVLQSLASPKGSKRAGGNETGEEPATPSARNGHKLGHKRRDTADFSIINSLLDESTASSTALHADNASDQLHAVAAKGRQGEETADFSSLMTLVQNGLTETETPPRDDGAKPSARPRARRHSNQKPGRDGQGARLAAPPSVPLGGPARVGEGGSAGSGSSGDVGGGGGKVSRPVSAKPKPPARRPRRSINLDPSRTPAASWEDYAVPTPEAVRYYYYCVQMVVLLMCRGFGDFSFLLFLGSCSVGGFVPRCAWLGHRALVVVLCSAAAKVGTPVVLGCRLHFKSVC